MKFKCYTFICLLFLFSCTNKEKNYLEPALSFAGDNRMELEKVLVHYQQNPDDSLKYKAAVFLIENMPGYMHVEYPYPDEYYSQVSEVFAVENKTEDQAKSLFKLITIDQNLKKTVYDLQTIRAAYLIDQIEYAFETRSYPWAQSVSWEDFCEFVLPYRTALEPFEDWRPLYKRRMKPLLDSLIAAKASDSLVCAAFMDFFNPDPNIFRLMDNGIPVPLKPSLYMEMNTGNCNDLTLFGQHIMRTAGLPVTFDFTPQWANRHLGHEWNAIISNGNAVPFQIADAVPYGEHLRAKSVDKMAKAYRRMYSRQKETLIMQTPKEEIPPLFRNSFLRDVSEYYFNTTDILVDLIYPPPTKKQYAYIMVFNNSEWAPIAWGEIKNGRVTFPKMNTGCVYTVMYYDNGRFYTGCDPFYINEEGERTIYKPNHENKQRITVLRKFPFRDVGVMTERMPGGKFQIANRADFADAITVHVIDTIENMTFQTIVIEDIQPHKYFRYLSSDKGHVFMAEMMVYDDEGNQLTGNIIGTEGSWDNNGADKTKVFDGDLLTFFDGPVASGGWVGLEFEHKERIKTIKYLPKNDDNHINKEELYELLYFDRKWVSLGQRTGDATHKLIYDVPKNAIFWLRNHTKGREERIFTYENGKQIWW